MRYRIHGSICLAIKLSPPWRISQRCEEIKGGKLLTFATILTGPCVSLGEVTSKLTTRLSPPLPSHSIIFLVHLESLSPISKAQDRLLISVPVSINEGPSWCSQCFLSSGHVERPLQSLPNHFSTDHQTLVAEPPVWLEIAKFSPGGNNVKRSCCKVDDHYNQFYTECRW